MAASDGSTGPVPNEREKTQAAATELVGGSNTGTEEKQQRNTLAAAAGEGFSSLPAAPITSTPPLPPRCQPLPSSGKRRRISKVAAKDPRRNLPTVVKPKDPYTAESVSSPREKALIREAARSVVSVSAIAHDGKFINQCTGICIGWKETKKCARILTSSGVVCTLDPKFKGGTGGPVIDNDGNVTGMAFDNGGPNLSILSISTILTYIEMWMKFSCIARPVHGLSLRTVELLDVSLQEVISLDHNINNGYIVDRVDIGSTAEKLGIRYGDVIVSFDGLRVQTLPQLEDYLLSLGWGFLQGNTDSSSTVDLKGVLGVEGLGRNNGRNRHTSTGSARFAGLHGGGVLRRAGSPE